MIHRHSRRLLTGLLAVVAAFCLLLLTTVGVLANTVHVYDNAHVLNASQVQSEAQTLPYPIDIYTVNNFNGNNKADFNRATANRITSPNLIVIAIDTVHKYVAIEGGKSVSTSNTSYNDAVNAFKSGYNSGGYTPATLAAIDQLRKELGAAPNGGSGNQVPVPGGNTGFAFPSFGGLCCIGLLVLAGIALFGVFRARRRRFVGGQPPVVGPYQQPYQQPYNQGYPPNYYGPGYNQGQGMNPWAAGGLGAAAGGFLGYELGKEQGEAEARDQQGNTGNFGGGAGGDFGNGSDGNFGGGAGGDFGGGGGDFGGGAGGDFGGGGGGDFGGGGGGDFGGGGGGDFGGGGGGDFGGGGGGNF